MKKVNNYPHPAPAIIQDLIAVYHDLVILEMCDIYKLNSKMQIQ